MLCCMNVSFALNSAPTDEAGALGKIGDASVVGDARRISGTISHIQKSPNTVPPLPPDGDVGRPPGVHADASDWLKRRGELLAPFPEPSLALCDQVRAQGALAALPAEPQDWEFAPE